MYIVAGTGLEDWGIGGKGSELEDGGIDSSEGWSRGRYWCSDYWAVVCNTLQVAFHEEDDHVAESVDK